MPWLLNILFIALRTVASGFEVFNYLPLRIDVALLMILAALAGLNFALLIFGAG
jgi:hypothetical protein